MLIATNHKLTIDRIQRDLDNLNPLNLYFWNSINLDFFQSSGRWIVRIMIFLKFSGLGMTQIKGSFTRMYPRLVDFWSKSVIWTIRKFSQVNIILTWVIVRSTVFKNAIITRHLKQMTDPSCVNQHREVLAKNWKVSTWSAPVFWQLYCRKLKFTKGQKLKHKNKIKKD